MKQSLIGLGALSGNWEGRLANEVTALTASPKCSQRQQR